MDNINVSEMTIQDLDSISSVLLSDFDDFWNYSVLKSELLNPNSKYLVVKKDNSILGFGGIWKAVDDIHITNIVVKKNFRNQNIGSTILQNLIQLCENENVISLTLEVNSNNIVAQKLYEKFGFKTIGIRKKYYNNTEDAIIMTKDLKNNV